MVKLKHAVSILLSGLIAELNVWISLMIIFGMLTGLLLQNRSKIQIFPLQAKIFIPKLYKIQILTLLIFMTMLFSALLPSLQKQYFSDQLDPNLHPYGHIVLEETIADNILGVDDDAIDRMAVMMDEKLLSHFSSSAIEYSFDQFFYLQSYVNFTLNEPIFIDGTEVDTYANTATVVIVPDTWNLDLTTGVGYFIPYQSEMGNVNIFYSNAKNNVITFRSQDSQNLNQTNIVLEPFLKSNLDFLPKIPPTFQLENIIFMTRETLLNLHPSLQVLAGYFSLIRSVSSIWFKFGDIPDISFVSFVESTVLPNYEITAFPLSQTLENQENVANLLSRILISSRIAMGIILAVLFFANWNQYSDEKKRLMRQIKRKGRKPDVFSAFSEMFELCALLMVPALLSLFLYFMDIDLFGSVLRDYLISIGLVSLLFPIEKRPLPLREQLGVYSKLSPLSIFVMVIYGLSFVSLESNFNDYLILVSPIIGMIFGYIYLPSFVVAALNKIPSRKTQTILLKKEIMNVIVHEKIILRHVFLLLIVSGLIIANSHYQTGVLEDENIAVGGDFGISNLPNEIVVQKLANLSYVSIYSSFTHMSFADERLNSETGQKITINLIKLQSNYLQIAQSNSYLRPVFQDIEKVIEGQIVFFGDPDLLSNVKGLGELRIPNMNFLGPNYVSLSIEDISLGGQLVGRTWLSTNENSKQISLLLPPEKFDPLFRFQLGYILQNVTVGLFSQGFEKKEAIELLKTEFWNYPEAILKFVPLEQEMVRPSYRLYSYMKIKDLIFIIVLPLVAFETWNLFSFSKLRFDENLRWAVSVEHLKKLRKRSFSAFIYGYVSIYFLSSAMFLISILRTAIHLLGIVAVNHVNLLFHYTVVFWGLLGPLTIFAAWRSANVN